MNRRSSIEQAVKATQVEYQVDAGLDAPAKKCHQPGAERPCRAAAGGLTNVNADLISD